MFHRHLFLIVFNFLFIASYAQMGQAKKALKMQARSKYEKAEALVNKALEKDEAFPAGLFVKASLLADTAYAGYNLDLARETIHSSRSFFTSLEEKEMTKHFKAGINLISINKLKEAIDRAAFQRAIVENSEERFIYFIETFNTAKELDLAKDHRDSLAFITAKMTNTYQAYDNFMSKYPEAEQVLEAKKRYEKLFFDISTADGKLETFENFLKLNPKSPYSAEAERNIYEIATADNTEGSYLKFMNTYSSSRQVAKARRFFYHTYKANNFIDSFPKKWLTDSLKYVAELDSKGPLIIFSKSRMYGFMSFLGEEVVPPEITKINADLLCNPLIDDFFYTDKGIIARDGSKIQSGKYENVEDLGYGVLKVTTARGVIALHKSGWPITMQRVHDVKLLKGQFLAFNYLEKWGLMTFSGRIISEPLFDDITAQGSFYIFETNGKYDVLNAERLSKAVNKEPINFQSLFTDFELIDNNHIWLQTPYGVTIFDEKLNEVVPFNQQKIMLVNHGCIVKQKDKVDFLDQKWKTKLSKKGTHLKYNNSFLAFDSASIWTLYNLSTYSSIHHLGKFDSTAVYGSQFAIGIKGDSTTVFFTNDKRLKLIDVAEIKLLAQTGSSNYLAIKFAKNKKTHYYNSKGDLALVGEFDEVIPTGSEYFVISSKGKKGLYDSLGNQLLLANYEAIANYSSGYVSTLFNKKFGIVNVNKKVKIQPDFDKNIKPYSDAFLVASKDNKISLIDGTGKAVSDSFEEITYWNDSTALVKQNHLWKFYEIYKKRLSDFGIKSLNYLLNSEKEKVVIALVANGYGVYSSTRGEIITPTFNDIINLGTQENMIFFTEKHVEEAEFYVVIYYDHSGQIIRKQAFEELDYVLIYCQE